ncbi:amidohydrolase family protein, partial [bacterium]|nr:amidohydrolase family protein [bacterium]
ARLHGGENGGCLAGSVLTMNRAFANLVDICGIKPMLAAKYTATNAARVLGIDLETGSIAEGKRADLAILDADYQCLATLVNGKFVYQKS